RTARRARHRRPSRPVSGRAVRRRAPARSRGPGPDEPPRPAPGRRTDRRARQPCWRAGHGPPHRSQPDRPDPRDRHPRPGPGHPLRHPGRRVLRWPRRARTRAGAHGMSAVWRAARAAVRRRRLQTAVIGLVALFATAALVVAVALLDAAHAPFERAFAAQRGAHLTIAFDAEASDEDLAA